MLEAYTVFLPGKMRQQWAMAEGTAYEKKTCFDQNVLTYFWQWVTAASGSSSETAEAVLCLVTGHMV